MTNQGQLHTVPVRMYTTTRQERRQKLAQPAHTAQRAEDYGALPK